MSAIPSGRSGLRADEELVVEFLNTLDVEADTDLLDDADGWSAWADRRGLTPDPAETARACRQVLRERALTGLAPDALPQVLLQVTIDDQGRIGLRPAGGAARPGVVGSVLSAVAGLAFEGRLDRVKICPADDCRWAFYDRSRNTSRQWCSMAVCGNRAKTKTFRAKGHADPD